MENEIETSRPLDAESKEVLQELRQEKQHLDDCLKLTKNQVFYTDNEIELMRAFINTFGDLENAHWKIQRSFYETLTLFDRNKISKTIDQKKTINTLKLYFISEVVSLAEKELQDSSANSIDNTG